MELKELFLSAFSDIRTAHGLPDDKAIVSDIMERAEKMKNTDKTEITAEQTVSERQIRRYRFFTAAAGAAAAVAVVGAGILGVMFLNTHGSMKERELSPLDASWNSYTAVFPQDADSIGIGELAGKTFNFSGCTVTVKSAGYDGQFVRIDYRVTPAEGETRYEFRLEPVEPYSSGSEANVRSFLRGTDAKGSDYTYIEAYPLAKGKSLRLSPISLGTMKERITDLIVTITKEIDSLIMQPVFDTQDNGIGAGRTLEYMFVSPFVLETNIGYEKGCMSYDVPEIYAVSGDGTRIPLTGDYYWGSVNPDKSGTMKFYYVPDETDTMLDKIHRFEVNGKMFDITETPFEPTSSAVTTASAETTILPQATPQTADTDTDADTTAQPVSAAAEVVYDEPPEMNFSQLPEGTTFGELCAAYRYNGTDIALPADAGELGFIRGLSSAEAALSGRFIGTVRTDKSPALGGTGAVLVFAPERMQDKDTLTMFGGRIRFGSTLNELTAILGEDFFFDETTGRYSWRFTDGERELLFFGFEFGGDGGLTVMPCLWLK